MTATSNTPQTAEAQDSPFTVRSLTDADWPAAKALDAAAFGYRQDDDFLDTVVLPTLELSRFTRVFDPALDDLLVGIGAVQSRRLTFPGGGHEPVAAVTWVGVRPDQQRRGVLRSLMTAQLHGLRANSAEPVAILTASESGIYGRFGYGLATHTVRLELSAPTVLRPGTPTEPVREVEHSRALPLLQAIHTRVAPQFPGYLDRSDEVLAGLFSEHPFAEKGRGIRRYAVHADGYIVYRLSDSWNERGPDYTLTVLELTAATPIARASLWRHVLAYPLVRKVVYPKAWVDEPLPELLGNPRALAGDIGDHVWVRLVDLSRALDLRRYSVDVDVVVRVRDRFCPWNDGTWRLALSGAGGRATSTSEPADVELDVEDLGAAFLGGTRLARLAVAGRVTGSPDGIAQLDAAFGTALRPWTPEGF